jgi:DNA-binding MarR family transcriptional regulator
VQPDPAHRAIASLQRLSEVFTTRRQQLAGEATITEAQWRVLEEVSGENFLPSMFARQRAITAAAVSRTLRQLSEMGFVKSTIGTDDGRQRLYQVTAKGQRAMQKIHQAREDAVNSVWSTLSARDLTTFAKLSEQLAERLEEYAARH